MPAPQIRSNFKVLVKAEVVALVVEYLSGIVVEHPQVSLLNTPRSRC